MNRYVYIIFDIDHNGHDRINRCFSDEETANRILIELKKRDEKVKPEWRGYYHLECFELEDL